MNFALIVDEAALPRWRVWVESVHGHIVDRHGPDPVDVVLVSSTATETLSVVSELLRQGKVVWLEPEATLGSGSAYELIPLDEEYPHRLHAIWPLRGEPAVTVLSRHLKDQAWGTVLQLQLERTLGGRQTFQPDQAHGAWLQDADLLRSLVPGEYQRVTAIHSGQSIQGITTASVGLSGEGVPDAMWVCRAGGELKRELTVTAERGTAVLTWVADNPPVLKMNCQSIDISSPRSPTEMQATSGVTSWSEAVRAFDLLDAAKRSLTRRRTVELQFESTSERSQFKTQMTACGCILLLLTMCGLIGLLLAGRMFDPRDTQQKQAEIAGFVLREDHFDGAGLTPHGREIMQEIADHYRQRSATILIEGEPHAGNSESRRNLVVTELTTAGFEGAGIRTVVRPLQGQWFKRAMALAWIVLFLPVGVMLALQLLIGLTQSGAASHQKNRQA